MAGITSSIYNFLTRRSQTNQAPLATAVLIGGTNGTSTNSGETISTDNAMDEAIVQNCVRVLAQGVAQLPLQVRRNIDDKTVYDNNIAKLLRKPNAYQTPYEFKYAIVHSIMIYGACFIHITRRDADRVPIAMVPLDPTQMTLSSSELGLPTFEYEDDMLDPRDVIHIKDISTFDVEGLSRIERAAELIGAYKAANRLMSDTFNGGINVQNVVTSPLISDTETAQKWSDSLADTFGSGKTRAGGWAVLGDAAVTQLKGSTPADADLRNLRKDLINEIAALFGVPAFMVGGSGDEKYSNVRQKQTSMYRDTFAPITLSIEEGMMMKLMGNNTDRIEFDVSSLLKGDQESQMRLVTQGVTAGILTPNEAREHLDYQAMDDDSADELVKPNETVETIDVDDQRGSEDEPNGMNPEATGG